MGRASRSGHEILPTTPLIKAPANHGRGCFPRLSGPARGRTANLTSSRVSPCSSRANTSDFKLPGSRPYFPPAFKRRSSVYPQLNRHTSLQRYRIQHRTATETPSGTQPRTRADTLLATQPSTPPGTANTTRLSPPPCLVSCPNWCPAVSAGLSIHPQGRRVQRPASGPWTDARFHQHYAGRRTGQPPRHAPGTRVSGRVPQNLCPTLAPSLNRPNTAGHRRSAHPPANRPRTGRPAPRIPHGYSTGRLSVMPPQPTQQPLRIADPCPWLPRDASATVVTWEARTASTPPPAPQPASRPPPALHRRGG